MAYVDETTIEKGHYACMTMRKGNFHTKDKVASTIKVLACFTVAGEGSGHDIQVFLEIPSR